MFASVCVSAADHYAVILRSQYRRSIVMGEVAQACELMKRALEILDAQGEHQSAGMLDLAIQHLPDAALAQTANWDRLGEASSPS
jgi:hypothetical protein